MKKTFTIFILLTLVLSGLQHVWAQAPVHYNRFGVMKSNANTGSLVYLGDAAASVQQVLGSPTRTDSYFSEIHDQTATRWYYNNCQLTFINGRLVLYDLNDATLSVGPDFANSFKVGNPIGQREIPIPTGPRMDPRTRTVDYFYGYHIQTTAGKSRNIPYTISSTSALRNNQDTFEGSFEVLFNSQKRIINIHMAED